LTDAFLKYWETLAKRFSKNEYVIGFDPLNEPFPSGFEEDVSIISQPGVFDRKLLAPLYEKVLGRLVQEDPDAIIYFETGFPESVDGKVFNVGFEVPPGGLINSKNHVLNGHSYCC
jgi:hypothetical protein